MVRCEVSWPVLLTNPASGDRGLCFRVALRRKMGGHFLFYPSALYTIILRCTTSKIRLRLVAGRCNYSIWQTIVGCGCRCMNRQNGVQNESLRNILFLRGHMLRASVSLVFWRKVCLWHNICLWHNVCLWHNIICACRVFCYRYFWQGCARFSGKGKAICTDKSTHGWGVLGSPQPGHQQSTQQQMGVANQSYTSSR